MAAGYVAATLPAGPLAGRYYRRDGAEPESLTVAWPGGWPSVRPTNRVHPRRDTPEAALGNDRRLRFSVV